MQIVPLQHYILCSVHEGREMTVIQLPDASNPMQPYALVLACGPDCKLTAVGDRVLFHPDNVIFHDDVNGEKNVIVPEACCFAKFVVDEKAVEQVVKLS